jgi:hypothetical protein
VWLVYKGKKELLGDFEQAVEATADDLGMGKDAVTGCVTRYRKLAGH